MSGAISPKRSQQLRPPGTNGFSRPQTPQMLRRPASSMSLRSPTPSSLSSRRPQTPSALSSSAQYSPGGSSGAVYSGNIQVSVRIKPPLSTSFEQEHGWEVDVYRNSMFSREAGEFTVDNVFDGSGSTTNRDIYERSVKSLVEQVMEGYHGTVFAYGMTGSGKTFTMQGSDRDPGVIPLSVQSIFDHIGHNQYQRDFFVKVSYLEIYNEHLHDLLNPGSSSDDIKLRDDPLRGVKATGLAEVQVQSADELLDYIAQGDMIRRTEGTDFNSRSSRSHAVVQISIDSNPRVGTAPNGNGVKKHPGLRHHSTLYLCDLAGSERAVSQSERRKEGAYINKSLLTLGTVIARLSSSSTGSSSLGHIPYRDSKLTRLLQPALSGRSLVSVLCTVQSTTGAYIETVSTLRFAARAKNIVVSAKRNDEMIDNSSKTIEKLMQQVAAQKLEIEQLRIMTGGNGSTNSSPRIGTSFSQVISQLEAENKILNERVEHLTRLCDDSHLEEILGVSADDSDSDSEKKPYQNQQIEEYKSYIAHLEKQLYQQELNKPRGLNIEHAGPAEHPTGYQHYQEIIQDLKEEIAELRESNRDKDSIINALRSLNKRKENLNSGVGTAAAINTNSSAYARYYYNPSSANSATSPMPSPVEDSSKTFQTPIIHGTNGYLKEHDINTLNANTPVAVDTVD
jgi:centromeric protein E